MDTKFKVEGGESVKITHCIFDMDGLLLDTERVYTEVSSEILAKFDKKFTWDLKSRMMGRKEADAAQLLIDEFNLPITAEEYLKERNQMQKARFPFCRPLPGVEANKIPIAVGTSSHTAAYELKTSQNQDLFKLFDKVVCGDNPAVVYGKPAPDIFIEAARQLGQNSTIPSPINCLVFEDATSGVQAGVAAGMNVVWVPDAKLKAIAKSDFGATEVLDSLEDFKPERYGLPPFDNLG